jgi:hypothetical protein
MWLAALCLSLSGFGAMVAISAGTPAPPPIVETTPDKATIGTGSSQDISAGTPAPSPIVEASPDKATIETGSSQDTLTKADKLEIAYVRDRIAVEPVMRVTKVPSETPPQPLSPTATPKIVSRHWHDPNAKKSAAASPDRRIKNKEPKKSKNVERAKLPVDLRPCPRPEGFAGLLRVLNLTPGCDS